MTKSILASGAAASEPNLSRSELAHTPGPWALESSPYEDGTPYFKITAGEPYIDGEKMGFGFSAIMREADARLIAAAPEMLAALEAHQLWSKRESEGPLYPWGMKRDSPGGEEIWRSWWNDQLRLCALSHELTDAALASSKAVQS